MGFWRSHEDILGQIGEFELFYELFTRLAYNAHILKFIVIRNANDPLSYACHGWREIWALT